MEHQSGWNPFEYWESPTIWFRMLPVVSNLTHALGTSDKFYISVGHAMTRIHMCVFPGKEEESRKASLEQSTSRHGPF